MIDTIFYFVDSLNFDEYQSRLSSGDIADRTIVFAEAQKAIYKDGVNYGNLTKDEMISIVKTIIHENPSYILPIATAVQLGGIMVGATLTIDENGTLNVNPDALPQGPIGPKGDTGETGAAGKDGKDGSLGVAGNFKSTVFKRSTTRPGRPSGGSYDNPVPEGWSDGIPEGTGAIWASSCTFFGTGGSTGWTIPQLQADSNTLDIEFSPSITQPNAPTGNMPFANHEGEGWYSPESANFSSAGTMIWRAERKVSNGEYSGAWVITRIYGEKGEKGDPGESSPYDDSAIREAIEQLQHDLQNANILSDEELERVRDIINNLDDKIKNKIESLFDDATWIEENFPSGSGSTSNFGEEDVENYLQRIGVWARDGEGNIDYDAWSDIRQDVSSLQTTVALIQSATGVDYEALVSSIDQKVADGIAGLNLETTYAKLDETKKVLEWLSSGFRSSTSSEMTYADMLAAANNGDHSGIANLYATVEQSDNKYVSKAGLEAAVDNAITGIVADTDGKYANTQIFAKVNENSEDIAEIVAAVTKDSSEASIGTKLANYLSGLVTRSSIDKTVSALIAKATGVPVQINKDGFILDRIGANTSGGTRIYITIDPEIEFDTVYDSAQIATIINNCQPTMDTYSNVTAELVKDYNLPIMLQNNNNGGKTWNIIATGVQTVVKDLEASITAGIKDDKSFIDAVAYKVNVNTDEFNVYNGDYRTSINSEGLSTSVYGTSSFETTNIIRYDGSGSLAKGNISWDVDGSTSFKADDFKIVTPGGVTLVQFDGTTSSQDDAIYFFLKLVSIQVPGLSPNGSIYEGQDPYLVIANYGNYLIKHKTVIGPESIAWLDYYGNVYSGILSSVKNSYGGSDYELTLFSGKEGGNDPDIVYFKINKTLGGATLNKKLTVDGDITANSNLLINGSHFNMTNTDLYVDFYTDGTDGVIRVDSNDTYVGGEFTYIGLRHTTDDSGAYRKGAEIKLYATDSITASIPIETTSDERLKTIVDTPEASIENIANVRVVDYYANDNEKKTVELGSIAQDWQAIYPNAVKEDKEGYLSLNYSGVALASAVEAAKEIVKLKAENAELKERLAAIEAKLGI